MIHKSIKPTPVKIVECRMDSVDISWDLCTLIEDNNNNQIQYRIFLGKTFYFLIKYLF